MAKFLNEFFPVLTHAVMDMNGGAGNLTGDYINMSKCEYVTFIIAYGDGSASHDVGITIYEATNSSGGSAAALSCLETGDIYKRDGADLAAYAALTTAFTESTQSTEGSVWTDLTSGESVGMNVVTVRPEELSDGFDYIRADLSDPTASKIMCCIAICKLKHQDDPASLEVPTV